MPTPTRVRLLRLAQDVAGEDADLGDPLAQHRLTVVVDALAHALVDLADGRTAPTQSLRWPPRSEGLRRGVVVDGVRSGTDDRASCSALAARLRRVAAVLDGPWPDPAPTGPLLDRVRQAAGVLADCLQDHAVALVTATTAAGRAECDRAVLRGLGTAYELLQTGPGAPGGDDPAPGPLPLPHDDEDHRDDRAPGHA